MVKADGSQAALGSQGAGREGTMNAHEIRELPTQPDGTHVAVCLCGWRSGPLESGDDAAAAGLLHQLRML